MNCKMLMNFICKEDDKQSAFAKQLESLCDEKDKLKIITFLIEQTNCDFDDARLVCDFIIDGIPLPSDLSPEEIARNNAKALDLFVNKPKCPTCGSTNVKKIPAFFQVPAFPGGAYTQFRCKNCGYEW